MKETNNPLYQILLDNPSSFLEVKGEWSLAKLTSMLNTRSRKDPKLATNTYKLVRESSVVEELFLGEDNESFYSYPSKVKTLKESCPEVIAIQNNLYILIQRIATNKECIYPTITGFSYGKKKSIIYIDPPNLNITPISFDI